MCVTRLRAGLKLGFVQPTDDAHHRLVLHLALLLRAVRVTRNQQATECTLLALVVALTLRGRGLRR